MRISSLPAFVALVQLSACMVGEPDHVGEDVEVAFSHEDGDIVEGDIVEAYYSGRAVTVEQIDGEYVYEGDILLHPSMVTTELPDIVQEPGEPTSVSSTGRTQARWPDGVVYYAIDPNLASPSRVTSAIAHWEANSNLTFKLRTTQPNYVYFRPSTGCSSYIGMIGGRQDINLASSCSTGSTIHEIGHAVGLWHEHSRADRAASVKINYANIQTGREHNFKTYLEYGWDGDEYTASLDFGSIMMYGSYSFSKNGLPTITRLNGTTFSIQRLALSAGDISGIDQMYPGVDAAPVYVNGQTYVISGLTVYRSNDRWYYYSRNYGWREVKLVDGRWYYA